MPTDTATSTPSTIPFSVRPTTTEEKDNNMPYITSSMLESVNTCPKWGMVRSIHNKHFTVGFRQLALEAGSLMHEVFATLNLFQVGYVQGLQDHMHVAGVQEFGSHRWEQISDALKRQTHTEQQQLEAGMFEVIATSEYYDDPDDRNRTLANLEHCGMELIAYWLSNLRDFDVFIANADDPTAEVGIEKSLDVVFTRGEFSFRFIGLVDVLYRNRVTNLVTHGEYKTASSMNDAWREAFQTRHQITGYNAALNAYFDDVANDTILIGSAVPVRKTTVPVQHFPIYRDADSVQGFIDTVEFTMNVIDKFKDNPLQAPMFTHSCMRYFRPCALIDLCASPYDDQIAMFEQMLVAPTLSPSEQKALLRKE